MKKTFILLTLIVCVCSLNAQRKSTGTKASAPAPTSSSSSSSSSSGSRVSLSSNSGDYGFSKGNIAISGEIGYSSGQTSAGGFPISTSRFAIVPSAMYMIQDNIGVGGRVGVQIDDNGGGSATTIVIGASGTYFLTPANQFSLFVNGGIDAMLPSGGSQISIGARPGLNYFINPNWSVYGTLGNFGVDIKSGGGSSKVDPNFGVNLNNLALGVLFVIK